MTTRFNPCRFLSGFVSLSMAMGLLLLVGCTKNASDAAKPADAVPVKAMEAGLEQIPFTLEVAGQAEGSKEVEVRARVGGILVKRFYQEGSSVKAGQVLFEIDKAPYEIALAQAKGQLAEQKARSEQAIREATRLKGLLNERAISQKEFDDASSNHIVAEAGLKAAEATVRQALLNLSYATVTAPVDGVSGRAERSEGALISTGADSLLTTIVQGNPIWVRFGVSDTDLTALRGGIGKRRPISKVEAVLPDGSVYPQAGRINYESAELDRQLGTVTLRAEFDNQSGALVPGQFVKIRLQAGSHQATLVPQTAALQTDRGVVVFVVDGEGRAQPRPVVTEGWSGTNWIVTSGIKPGEKVILDNLLKLKAGTPVKVDSPAVAPDLDKASPAPSATPVTKS